MNDRRNGLARLCLALLLAPGVVRAAAPVGNPASLPAVDIQRLARDNADVLTF